MKEGDSTKRERNEERARETLAIRMGEIREPPQKRKDERLGNGSTPKSKQFQSAKWGGLYALQNHCEADSIPSAIMRSQPPGPTGGEVPPPASPEGLCPDIINLKQKEIAFY